MIQLKDQADRINSKLAAAIAQSSRLNEDAVAAPIQVIQCTNDVLYFRMAVPFKAYEFIRKTQVLC